MKIIAIGLNYPAHATEFREEAPTEPLVFLKPDSALLINNKPFFIPNFSNEIHYETEVLVRINRLGKNIAEKFAPRYYDAIGLGIDFTARDRQQKARNAGHPWETSKAFDGSAVVSQFLPIENFNDVQNIDFWLDINGKTVQQGNTKDMIFGINKLIAYVSQFFTLRTGDILFTGTPQGVGQVFPNDKLEGYLNGVKMFHFNVK